jgi:diguanylate cyclase (GGDEF)-like protein
MASFEIVLHEGEIAAVRLRGRQFSCEDETGEVFVPEKLLTDLRLSEIPDGIVIKPTESVSEDSISAGEIVGLSRFQGGSAEAFVEFEAHRKYWYGEAGLSKYAETFRKAISEHSKAQESDFDEADERIYIRYEIQIVEDLEIQNAIKYVRTIAYEIEERTDLLLERRLDGVTGLLDRRSFDVDLDFMLRNTEGSIGLAMADIDYFKRVNDTYGHQVGDAVLRAVADVLSACCPVGAVAYRHGGEELAVLLLRTNKANLLLYAESVRTRVEALTFPDMPDLKVTVSLGVALIPEDANGRRDLIKKADDALYATKQKGRNCVCGASTD